MDHPELKIHTEDKKILRLLELPSGSVAIAVIDASGKETSFTAVPMEKRDLIAEFLRV